MNYYSITDIGRKRSQNQDAYANLDKGDYFFAVVCDGMGGHEGGAVASTMATEVISREVEKNFGKKKSIDVMIDAIKEASRVVYEEGQKTIDCANMGTTVVACLIEGDICHIAHVGDSRLYRYDGKLTRLTEDHSLLNDLLRTGSITEEEAKNFYARNTITRAVGVDRLVEVDSISVEVSKKTIFLACTDGLSGYVEEDDIRDVLDQPVSLKEMAESLVYMANASGGRDNVTVTLVEMEAGQ